MNEKKENYDETNWLGEEFQARKNRKWLRYSSQIARRVLAELRNNKNINQKELGAKIGVSPQYINKVVKGRENLTLETIGKLSDALGVELITFPIYKYSTLPLTFVANATLAEASGLATVHVGTSLPAGSHHAATWCVQGTEAFRLSTIAGVSMLNVIGGEVNQQRRSYCGAV